MAGFIGKKAFFKLVEVVFWWAAERLVESSKEEWDDELLAHIKKKVGGE